MIKGPIQEENITLLYKVTQTVTQNSYMTAKGSAEYFHEYSNLLTTFLLFWSF